MESKKNIFTLGSSTRSPQEFLDLLVHYQVEAIVDVRRFPTSRFEHFIKESLAPLLEEEGIAYLYLGEELGGYRSGGYEAYMKSKGFEAGLARLQEVAQEKTVAIMCSERLPWRCHRRHIGRALQERGWEVQHLIDLNRVWIPKERQKCKRSGSPLQPWLSYGRTSEGPRNEVAKRRKPMPEWMKPLKGHPIPWLLESESPSVRYFTLTDILNRPVDAPEAVAARQSIPTWPPVAALLAAQKRGGYWVKRDYYLPKNYGTFWVLSVLADLGLTAENTQVRLGCEFMFQYQRQNGSFCRRRRVKRRGIIWETQPDPCTHARIARFLMQFGYGRDSHTRAAIDWLLATQREDGMWLCAWAADRHGCLRATLDYLRAAVLDTKMAAQPATARAAQVVYSLLLEPKMGRYHVADLWTILEYPHFGYGVIGALDTLMRLGYRLEQPRIVAAVEHLLSRQGEDGTWSLDQAAPRPPLNIGQLEEPNKWLTLDALRVIKGLYSQS